MLTGFGRHVFLSPADDAEAGDVILVALAVMAPAAPEPFRGFCVGDVRWPDGWSTVEGMVEVTFPAGPGLPVAVQLLWTRLGDDRSPFEFSWPTERLYLLDAASYRGTCQLGVPILRPERPTTLVLGPSQAELDMAEAVAVAGAPAYGFLGGLDALQKEMCDWVEERLGDFDVEQPLSRPDDGEQPQHGADSACDEGDPAPDAIAKSTNLAKGRRDTS